MAIMGCNIYQQTDSKAQLKTQCAKSESMESKAPLAEMFWKFNKTDLYAYHQHGVTLLILHFCKITRLIHWGCD